MTKVAIKKWYVGFLERDKRGFLGTIFYFCLYQLSVVYGACIKVRNSLYDAKAVSIYRSPKKIISIGGLSWAGAGKTTLAMYLYDKLSATGCRACIVRRGYGDDENKLIKAFTENAFFSVDRIRLVQSLESRFDVFLLDDGFQYRKLARDYDIVMMTSDEWKRKKRLLPASIFREPLTAITRGNALLVTYTANAAERMEITQEVAELAPALNVYFAHHSFRRFVDVQGRAHELSALKNRKVAALSGIGYPQGFLGSLRDLGIAPARTFLYPDHYALAQQEFDDVERELIGQGIRDVLITQKDSYHIPRAHLKINVIVMEISITVSDEDGFLKNIKDRVLSHV